ncbi:MAG: translocation/assembly module TamB domain-containing protein, partial [Pseudomonadota bacterium]
LSIAEAFIADAALEGTADFNLALAGAPSLRNLTGQITTRDARLFSAKAGLTLSPISADIALAGGRADVRGTALLEGTPIDIAGRAALEAPFPLDIGLRAVRLPVRYADILQNETSFDLALRGDAARLALSGDIRIEDTEIRIPDTGLGGAPDIPPIRHEGAPVGVRQTLSRAGLSLTGQDAGQAGAGPLIPLDLTLTALTPVFVRGRGIDAGFDGSVRIIGTAAAPVPVGQLDLTRGRLDFLGRRLDLNEGRITVAGALIPRIEIIAQTVVEDVTAEIALNGPVDEPELSLSSSPELPEDEILARILFGRGIETLSAFQLARLVNSVRKLSGTGGAGALEAARGRLGVDDLDLRENAETGETELAIGQTLNEGVYSEIEVGSGGTTTLNLNFDLSDTTTLRGSASSDGETGLGIFWERDY